MKGPYDEQPAKEALASTGLPFKESTDKSIKTSTKEASLKTATVLRQSVVERYLEPEEGSEKISLAEIETSDVDKQRELDKKRCAATPPASNGESVLSEIAPMPAAQSAGSSGPGAYPRYPAGARRESNAASVAWNLGGGGSSYLQYLEEASTEGNEGLVQARPVTQPQLDRAQPVSVEDIDIDVPREGTSKHKSYKRVGILCGIAIVAAVVLIVVFLVVDDSASPKDSEMEELANNTSTDAPTLLDKALAVLPLPDYTIETLRNDKNASTPQTMALEWLLADPDLYNYSETRRLQRFVAATLYYSTNGNSTWTYQGGEANQTVLMDVRGVPTEVVFEMDPWLSSDHECDWFWTWAPNRQTKPTCREDGTFQFLDLSKNGLSGSLPEELSILSWLEGIRFGWSDINGPFPTWVGRMTRLQEIRLNQGKFVGTLPTELSLLSNTLQDLSLVANGLEGNFLQDVWELTNLKTFLISRTMFHGTFPNDVGYRLPNISRVVASRTMLSGSIPTSVGLWSNLSSLSLAYTQMTGTLPTELGKLVNLNAELSLGNNQFFGTVPSELGQLTSLTKLYLKGNTGLSGSLPAELANLRNEFLVLNLEETGISGTIPTEVCVQVEELRFTCSSILCGCDCPCNNNTTGNFTGQ